MTTPVMGAPGGGVARHVRGPGQGSSLARPDRDDDERRDGWGQKVAAGDTK
jgi:hypothetical protein